MSWLNISDSISSFSNNISSFTKEVLTEAIENQEEEEGIQDAAVESQSNFERVTSLKSTTDEEIERLRSALLIKQQEVHQLEMENNQTRLDFEKHSNNLKQHMLDKDAEVENIAEKLRNLEADLNGKIDDLTYEKDKLTAELLEVSSKDICDESSSQDAQCKEDLERLKEENESFSNELMMKEIVLNSIEAQMRDVSKQEVDVADFSMWLNEFVSVKNKKKEDFILNWFLDNFKDVTNDEMVFADLDKTKQWLLDKVCMKDDYDEHNETKILHLEERVNSLELFISDIGSATNVFDHHFSQEEFSVDSFKQWLMNVKQGAVEQTKNEELLMKIQNEIRDFDDEDKDFIVDDFTSWLEKVQTRIDELEVDLINLQEMRDSDGKQREIEREKLEELFNEKQKEIGFLKVELYNKSSVPSHDENTNFEDTSLLQEELNELQARCDALKDELVCSHCEIEQLQNINKSLESRGECLDNESTLMTQKICEQQTKFLEKCKDYEIVIEDQNNKLKELQSKELNSDVDKTNAHLIELNQVLEKEKLYVTDKLHRLGEAYNELKSNQNSAIVEALTLFLNGILSGEPANYETMLKFEHTEKFRQVLKEFVTSYKNNQIELHSMQNEIAYLNGIANFLDKSFNKAFPEQADTWRELGDDREKRFEAMFGAVAELQSTCGQFNMEQTGGEYNELHEQLVEQEKEMEELRAELKNKTMSGHNTKFGGLKRKLLEVENENSLLVANNKQLNEELEASQSVCEEIKKRLSTKSKETMLYAEQCQQLQGSLHQMNARLQQVNVQTSSSMQQDQLHHLSRMLTDKTDECEQLKMEYNVMQGKLLVVENETSDMELLREECKQLKSMLMGKEHENKVDETIALLQAECRQLKQLVATNDVEYNKLLQLNVEKENELSDMQLIREECKQLKEMLVSNTRENDMRAALTMKDVALQQKDAVIAELQNSASDMELVQEECKKLKEMLIENSSAQNSIMQEEQNSFMVQVQQLEEFLQGKDNELEESHVNLRRKDAIIADLQSTVANMELLQNECNFLKEMLVEKESLFEELQADIDGANISVQLKNEELKRKDTDMNVLEGKLDVATENYKNLEKDYEMLKEELNETMIQDENIHLLQTEYRNVEEKLSFTTQELHDAQQKLFESETQNERVKVYEEQYAGLTLALKTKEEELKNLRLQSSETSILESDTVLLLQKELNELKALVFERETECTGLADTLEKKTSELQDMYTSLLQANRVVKELKCKVKTMEGSHSVLVEGKSDLEKECLSHQESIENLRLELIRENENCASIEKCFNDKQVELKESLDEVSKLEREIVTLESSLKIAERATKIVQTPLERDRPCLECLRNKEDIDLALEAMIGVCRKLNATSEGDVNNLAACVRREVNRLVETLQKVEDEKNELARDLKIVEEDMRKRELESNQEVALITKKLDETLKLNVQSQEEYEFKVKDLQSQIREYIELDEMYKKEYSVNQTAKNNYKSKCNEYTELETLYKQKCLESRELEGKFTEKCTEFQALMNLHERKCVECVSLEDELANGRIEHNVEVECIQQKHTEVLNDSLEEIDTLKQQVDLLRKDDEDGDKIRLLQKKYEEKTKSHENDLLQLKISFEREREELALKLRDSEKVLTEKHKTEICVLRQENETLQSGSVKYKKECEENEGLRNELKEASHSLLKKNKDCDLLKVDVLQMEEKLYEARMLLSKMKRKPDHSEQLERMREDCALKDEELKKLQLCVEDYAARLENAGKERGLLQDLAQQKSSLEQAQRGLLFEKQQMMQQLREQEVSLKHHDVKHKEVEAKTARELERLREHLMRTEESHTKDIIELQGKEDALEKELAEAKQALSRKNIILHDSSKQFQEHVVSIEGQLHSVAQERDANLQDLTKYKEKMNHDELAIYNLQSALEQLEIEKMDQYDYLTSIAKRKENELQAKLQKLTEEYGKTKGTIEEASLAVQGITKLNMELNQKEEDLKGKQERIEELSLTLQQREAQFRTIQAASDGKIDKFLIANLLLQFFQAENNKRTDILQVIGGLLGWQHHMIKQIGDGSAPSKGWMSSVWGFGNATKSAPQRTRDVNESFSELFVKFLETETESKPKMTAASLLNGDPTANNLVMLSPTPDILAFHNKKEISSRIPAPGQEIARVHTHYAQSTLKTILS